MPVYNEEACIAQVVSAWREALARLGIEFRMIVLNDGSCDGTAGELEAFAGDERVSIIHKPNSGHGPTLLEGYRRAARQAAWVFQCDSDDEMPPEAFEKLWQQREQLDAIFGIRTGRVQGPGRKLISAISRLAVRTLFAGGVRDVNVPYRLIRGEVLGPIVERLPADTFAPNVIISGAVAMGRWRIANEPVPHQGRRTGKVSIVKWRLWKAAARSLVQTIRCRNMLRDLPRRDN